MILFVQQYVNPCSTPKLVYSPVIESIAVGSDQAAHKSMSCDLSYHRLKWNICICIHLSDIFKTA